MIDFRETAVTEDLAFQLVGIPALSFSLTLLLCGRKIKLANREVGLGYCMMRLFSSSNLSFYESLRFPCSDLALILVPISNISAGYIFRPENFGLVPIITESSGD